MLFKCEQQKEIMGTPYTKKKTIQKTFHRQSTPEQHPSKADETCTLIFQNDLKKN